MFHTLSQVPKEQITAHALDVIEQATTDCIEFDMRTPEVLAALDELGRVRGIEAFRRALDINDPSARYEAAFQALRLIRQQFRGR